MLAILLHYGNIMTWFNIESAPFDRDLELMAIDANGKIHAVVFPCRRTVDGWIKTATGAILEIFPTHWRDWEWLDSRD